ncbi:MAG: hypothetical protein ACREOK_07705 [Gemmatimonadaceae bacterium]
MTNDDIRNEDYDFGADADVIPLSDPEFDAWLARVAPGLNEPGATPRAEIWRAVQSGRNAARVIPIRRNPWRLMSLIAAALLLGVALDRMVLRREGASSRVAGELRGPAASDSDDPARLYRMAAVQTLTQAEALLTAFRAGAPQRNPESTDQLGRWGREILSSTRLLMDSPAGDDPQLQSLLEDLELVLVQIVQLSGAPLDPADRALIDRALESRDLLPRIRTAVPAGVPSAASTSAD